MPLHDSQPPCRLKVLDNFFHHPEKNEQAYPRPWGGSSCLIFGTQRRKSEKLSFWAGYGAWRRLQPGPAAGLALVLDAEAVQLVQPVGDGLAVPAERQVQRVVPDRRWAGSVLERGRGGEGTIRIIRT